MQIVIVDSGMQPRERQLQGGKGDGMGGGGKITVKSGSVIVVRLFVVIVVVPPVPMADVGKPGCLSSLVIFVLTSRAPTAVPPPAQRRCRRQWRHRCRRCPSLCSPSRAEVRKDS